MGLWGGLRECTYDPKDTGVSSRRWNISIPGVARWLAKGKTHAQRGLQWKYTCGGRSGEGPCT